MEAFGSWPGSEILACYLPYDLNQGFPSLSLIYLIENWANAPTLGVVGEDSVK